MNEELTMNAAFKSNSSYRMLAEMPTKGQFIAIWEYNRKTWCYTVRWATNPSTGEPCTEVYGLEERDEFYATDIAWIQQYNPRYIILGEYYGLSN